MKKTYSKSSRQGLPGGPNEMFEKVKGIIVSQRGQWDFPGMNTLVPTDDGRITMRGVPYPVYGQDETGYGQMMYPNQEYQFPGNNVLELPMAQRGGLPKFQGKARSQVPTLYVDPNDPVGMKRYQAYRDSSDIFDFSKKTKLIYDDLPKISKEEYDRLNEKHDNLPHYAIDREGYNEDRKAGKVKDLREYVYQSTNRDYSNHPLYIKNNLLFNASRDKELEEIESGKYDIILKDGSIKSPSELINGKPSFDSYIITSPTGGERWYDSSGLFMISHPDIKPISTEYYGEDKLTPDGGIDITGTGWYQGKAPSMKLLNSYNNYDIRTTSYDLYKKPVQPVELKKGSPLLDPAIYLNNNKKSLKEKVLDGITRNIMQGSFQTGPNQYQNRVRLITPKHEYHMTPRQYSNLLPTDSIPQQGNFLYRLNRQQLGGSLPTAQMLGQFNPQSFQPNPITGLYNWEKPRVKPKLSDFEPKQKAAPRSSTSVATKSDPVKAARQINSVAAEEYERNRQGVIRATNRPVSVFRPGAGDPEAVMEYTGVPSAVRIAQNPESVNDFLSGVDQLILGSSPVSGMMGMRRDFTPEETQALLDYSTVATMGLPLVRGAGKLGAQGLRQTGKYLTQGPLKNAYKLNSRAWKPNPDSYYRMGKGRKFLDDVIETNKVRAYNENSYVNLREAGKISGIREDGKIVLKAKTFPEADTYWSKGVPLDGRYSPRKYGDYMIEASNDIPFIKAVNQRTKQQGFWDAPDVNYNATHTRGQYVKPRQSYDYDIQGNIKPSTGTPLEYNPNLIKLYEPHWWKGYKPINTPKQLPGSPNVVSSVDDVGKVIADTPHKAGFIDFKGAFQKYPKGLLTEEEILAYKNTPQYKRVTKEHLDMVDRYGDRWKLGNYMEDALQKAIATGNRSKVNPVLYGGRNWDTPDYIIAGLAGTTFPSTAGIIGLGGLMTFSPPAVKNKIIKKLGLSKRPPVGLSSKDTIIDITNRPMDFAKVNQTKDGQIIIGGEFIEYANNTVRKAKDWLNAVDTYSDKEYPSKDIQSFYGIEDGKFKVGKADEFKPNTEIVPRRFGAININKAVLNGDEMRLLDEEGKPIYQNTPNTGKFILYSPSTGKAQFTYINSGKSGVEKVNSFLEKNKDAQYIHLDNGRYEYYGINPEGLTEQNFQTYYQQDLEKEGNPGYNMIIKQLGGSLPRFQYAGKFNPQLARPNPLTGKYVWEQSIPKKAAVNVAPKIQPAARATTNVQKQKLNLDRDNRLLDANLIYSDASSNPLSNAVHTGLDAVGMVPLIGEPADLANALLYNYEGDLENAALSTAGMIPFLGMLGTGKRLLGKATNQLEGYSKGLEQLAKLPVIDYAKEFGHSIKKGKLPTYESIYRWQPDVFPESLVNKGKTLTPLQQGLTGSWYTKNPGQLAFYMRARPGAGNVNKIRLSDRQIANLESSMPDYAKGMSGKVNSVPTSKSAMPGELIVPESIRSKSVPIRFQVNPIDYSPQSVADEITRRKSYRKNLLNSPYFLPGHIDRTIQNEVIEEHARDIYTPILKAQEQPILRIPRKYFPFQGGGSLPKAQVGGDEIFPGEGQYYNIPEYTYNYKRGFDDLPDPVYSGPLMSQRLIDEATQREYEQRRRAIEESVAAAREPLSTQRLARESAATGDKFSLQMNLGDPYNNPRLYETLGALDFINPGVMLGDMVTGLGSVPYNVQEGNYGAATFGLGLPLATGALASIGVKSPRQFVNNLVNPVAGIGDTPKQLPGSSNVAPVINTAPAPWTMQEMPGLHIKSTMSDGAISKIVEPKTGLVNVEQALGIIGKESGGADKVALIKQGLGETLPKKMDYNEFRKLVQDQLIPLERQFVTHRSGYGINALGYNTTTMNFNTGAKTVTNAPLENQTLILGNKNKFGKGSSAHNNPDHTLGHAHFLRDAETPDVLTVTQIQSDAFQGTHRIMPKSIDEASAKLNNLREDVKHTYSTFGDEADKFKDVMASADKHLNLEEAHVKNFTQKQLLDKNHQERYLQELVNYAGERGDINKLRVPTSETASKVQGFGSHKDVIAYKKELLKNADNQAMKFALEKEITILKKYSEQPKTIKKLFGEEPKIVTDSKGNTWYEFDIPKKFKEGKGEIKAFSMGGNLNFQKGGIKKLSPYGELQMYPTESGAGLLGEVGLDYQLPFGNSAYLSNSFNVEPGYGSYFNPGFGIEQPIGGNRGSFFMGAEMFDGAPRFNAGLKYRFQGGGSLPNAPKDGWLMTAKDWQDVNTNDYGAEEAKIRNADTNKYDIYRLPGNKFKLVPKTKKSTQPVKYKPDPEIVAKQQQLNVAPASDKQSNTGSTPYRNFARETISQVPYRNPTTGETETRMILSTPQHYYYMTPGQYSNLLPTDSIPREGNYLYKKSIKQLGGSLSTAGDPVLNFIQRQSPRFSKSKK